MSTANFKDEKFLRQLWNAPELAIEKLNLVYASDSELKIRRKRKKKYFIYEFDGKTLRDKNEIKRINSLVIPPA